jgi:hypothetical protein
MAVTRANLGGGPAIVTLNGATLFMRDDMIPKHAPEWQDATSSLHGVVDKWRGDLVIKHTLLLFGLWQNLSALFPASVLNPEPGKSIFGTTDNPMVIHARNGDKITYPNAQITGLPALFLGVDAELFAAAVEVTALIKNNTDPETAGAYFLRETAAFSEATFALDNFKKTRFTAAWGAKTGFTSFQAETGFNVTWKFDAQPRKIGGLTVDMYVGPGGLVGGMKCVPIGPTQAQIDTAQAIHTAHGSRLGAGAADLTMTGTGASVVLKNAAITESATAFGIKPLRVGEIAWETTRGFTAGVAQAVATVA